MTAQAGQAKEHNEKQDDVSDKWHDCAESDAVQVVHTVDFSPCRAQLWINKIQYIQMVETDGYLPARHLIPHLNEVLYQLQEGDGTYLE